MADNKKFYLDKTGLDTLWGKICENFLPQKGGTITGTLGFSGTTYPHIYGNGSYLGLGYKTNSSQVVVDSESLRRGANNTVKLGSASYPWNMTYTSGLTIKGTDNANENSINFTRSTFNYIYSPAGSNIGIHPGGISKTSTTGYKFDATSFYPGVNNTYNIGTNSLKWANVYANNFIGNASSATRISKTISLSSNSNTNTGKYRKFGTIDVSSGAWTYGGGLFHIYTNESFDLDGLLACHIRTSSTIENESVSLYWLSLNSDNMSDCISVVKTENGKFDLYFKAKNNYMSLVVECYTQIPEKITLSSAGSWVDSPGTIRATSILNNVSKFRTNTINVASNVSGVKYYKLTGLKTDTSYGNKSILIQTRNGSSIILTSSTSDSTKVFYAHKFGDTNVASKITNIYYDTTNSDIYLKLSAYFNSITVSDLTNSGSLLELTNVSTLPTSNLTEIVIHEFLNSNNYSKYALPLSGGTLNTNSYIKLPNTSSIIHTTDTTSNAVASIMWYKGTATDSTKNYAAQFGWHNTGGTNGNGAAYIIPNPQDIDPWTGQTGLYITETNLKFNNKEVSVAGHTHNYAGSDSAGGPANSVKITPNSNNVACELWFCDSSRTLNKGTITYDNDLRYNPSTNQLMLGNINANTATPTTANVIIDGANKKISVGSSFMQYNSTTGCLEITA